MNTRSDAAPIDLDPVYFFFFAVENTTLAYKQEQAFIFI